MAQVAQPDRRQPTLPDEDSEMAGAPVRRQWTTIAVGEHPTALTPPLPRSEPLQILAVAMLAQRSHRGVIQRQRPSAGGGLRHALDQPPATSLHLTHHRERS